LDRHEGGNRHAYSAMNELPKKKRESPGQKFTQKKKVLLKKGTLKKLCKEGEGKEGRKVK